MARYAAIKIFVQDDADASSTLNEIKILGRIRLTRFTSVFLSLGKLHLTNLLNHLSNYQWVTVEDVLRAL